MKNTHGDEFWGTVGTGGKAGKGGRGSNHLGKILTKVRGGTPQTTSSPSKTTKQHMFVFGSNLDGRNGKGAALHAQKFGASKKGVRGADLDRVEGNTYSLPTKLRPSDLKFNPK